MFKNPYFSLLAAVLLLTSSSQALAEELTFVDVDVDYVYGDAIDFIVEEGIVSGYSNGTFQPERILNRAELLKIIVEGATDADLSKYGEESCFKDVASGQWFTKYVCYAKEQGIVKGYDDGRFRPDEDINLVEALKIVLEAFDYQYEVLDPWFKGIVDRSAEFNIIPVDFRSFDQPVERGQMADMVARLLKFKRGELAGYLGSDLIGLKVNYTTLDAGLAPSKVGASCTYDGKTYLDGASFDSVNDCNKCTCAGGVVACTLMYCPNPESGKTVEDLALEVCGNGSFGTFGLVCAESKMKLHLCKEASKVSYGARSFLKCFLPRSVSEVPLVAFDGNENFSGYTLLTYGINGEVLRLNSQQSLMQSWGNVVSAADAVSLVKAFTGFVEVQNVSDFTAAFPGEITFLKYMDAILYDFSEVKEKTDGYYFNLYSLKKNGGVCDLDSIMEHKYRVSGATAVMNSVEEVAVVKSLNCKQ